MKVTGNKSAWLNKMKPDKSWEREVKATSEATKRHAVKDALIEVLIDHHRHCDGCDIALYPLRQLAESYGIEFTEDEHKLFS